MSVNKVEFGNEILIDLTKDTVTADRLLMNTRAHDASGAEIKGTIPNNETLNGIISSRDQTVSVPKGYYNADSSVKISDDARSKLIADNIRRGITLLGINGTCSNVQVGWFSASTQNLTAYTLSGLSGKFNSLIMICPGTIGYTTANNNRLSRLCYIPNKAGENTQYISAQAYKHQSGELNATVGSSNVVFNESAGTCSLKLPSSFMLRYQYIWAVFYL